MSNILPFPTPTTNCLRCGEECRSGTPDMKKRAIRQAAEGFCDPWPKGREPQFGNF